MRTSEHGIEFIASFEGFRSQPYRDSGGIWTIGYGHTGPGTSTMGSITRAKGLELLADDVHKAEAAVNGLHLRLTQGQFDALVSIVYNCGPGILAPTKTLGKALRADGMRGVPAGMSVYTHDAAGHQLDGLVRRRHAEADLWGKPEGPTSWLTPAELRRCRELDQLRRAEHPSAEQKRRIAVLVSVLTKQRKRIWRAAQEAPKGDGHGWDYRDRARRYRSLLARTT